VIVLSLVFSNGSRIYGRNFVETFPGMFGETRGVNSKFCSTHSTTPGGFSNRSPAAKSSKSDFIALAGAFGFFRILKMP
jgi:hypothetical protein